MILLTLLCLTLFDSSWFSQAFPLDNNHIVPDGKSGILKEGGCRSIIQVLGGCIATLVACSWVAVHPNVPAQTDGPWKVFKTRFIIMTYFLLAPEIVLVWAARQWYSAWCISDKYKDKEWTMIHGFFFVMGGFTLHDSQGTSRGLRNFRELEKLVAEGKLEWPRITQGEIKIRKIKWLHLLNAVLLVQVMWFIYQVIYRGENRLSLAQIEVATLAYVVLAGLVYSMWWHKPNISWRKPVAPGEHEPLIIIDRSNLILRDNSTEEETSPTLADPQNASSSQDFPYSSSLLRNPVPLSYIARYDAPIYDPSIGPSALENPGRVAKLFDALILDPFQEIRHGLAAMLGFISPYDPDSPRIPEFYASDISGMNVNGTTAIAGFGGCITFGLIYSIPWAFHFPSVGEAWIWRISAISVAVIPGVVYAMSFLRSHVERALFSQDNGEEGRLQLMIFNCVDFVGIGLVLALMLARMTLVVLPIIALRSFPHGSCLM